MADKPKSSFLAFFLAWAEFKGWEAPGIHARACHWLEHRGDLAVLRCFRGFGKSTVLACYNAWRFWNDQAYRILHQGDQDKTAFKTSRDTKAVLRRHPWTADWFASGARGEASFWWCPGADDERNPPSLGIIAAQIQKIPGAEWFLIPASPHTCGHGTTGQAVWWKHELQRLLEP